MEQEKKKGVPVWVWVLALVPVAISAIGILSALAIYGVSKYMKTAKATEAQTMAASWGAGLAQCGEREGKLPASSTPVPASLSEVKGKKYQSSAGDWAQAAHVCAGFKLTGPQYFQYRWEQHSDDTGAVHAVADLDGDAVVDVEVRVDVTCAAGKCSARAPVTKGDVGTSASPGSTASSGVLGETDGSGQAPSSGTASTGVDWGVIAAASLFGMAILVSFVAGIWLAVIAFQESIAWGLLTLFVPCAHVIFAIQFWDKAKRAFLLSLGSLGAMIVAMVILVVVADPKSVSAASPIAGAAATAEASAAAGPPDHGPGVRLPPPPPVVVVPELTGAPADLSTVMGKARKLANQWDQDAALLGIEATLVSGVIQTAEGGTAKLTFGPSPFESVKPKSGVFVVTYDQSGIAGTPAKGPASKALPEPMCAPEAVYAKLAVGEARKVTLRYGFDGAGRPAWTASLGPQAAPRQFEPQRCDPMAVAGSRR